MPSKRGKNRQKSNPGQARKMVTVETKSNIEVVEANSFVIFEPSKMIYGKASFPPLPPQLGSNGTTSVAAQKAIPGHPKLAPLSSNEPHMHSGPGTIPQTHNYAHGETGNVLFNSTGTGNSCNESIFHAITESQTQIASTHQDSNAVNDEGYIGGWISYIKSFL